MIDLKTIKKYIPFNYILLAFGYLILLFGLNFSLSKYFIFFGIPAKSILLSVIFFLIVNRICYQSFWQSFILLIVTSCAGIIAFYKTSQGQLIFSDDFPSFLYRLQQLKENFPNIPFYNPSWNAGVEAREFFASGIINFYLIFSFFINLFPIEIIFNHLIVVLLLIIFPLSLVYAARINSGSWQASFLAATLGLAANLFFYTWALKYGTLGFITSLVLLPTSLSLGWKCAINLERLTKLEIFLLIVTTSLTLMWPLIFCAYLPLIAYSIWNIQKLFNKKIVVIFLLLAAINSFWIIPFYISIPFDSVINPEQIEDFVNAEADPNFSSKTALRDYKNINTYTGISLTLFKRYFQAMNPIILLFLFPAILFGNSKQKIIFGSTIMWLLLVAYLGPVVKPQLELERMYIVVSILFAIPIAIILTSWFEKNQQNLKIKAFKFFCYLIIWIIPIFVYHVYTNKTIEKYYFALPLVNELTEAIKKYSGTGRVLFAGFILHEFSYGHVAPLAYFTQRPLMASRYQHDRWVYTDIIPESYRKRKKAGVKEYLDLYNVSAVVTHDKFWTKWYMSQPKKYQHKWKYKNFNLFSRVNFPDSYFLEGSGTVIELSANKVILKLSTSDALLRFNYLPILEAGNCNIKSRPLGLEVNFIELTNCPTMEPINLQLKSISKRLRSMLIQGN